MRSMRRTLALSWAGFLILVGVGLLTWVGYNLLIELQPSAAGRHPGPAVGMGIAAIWFGLVQIRRNRRSPGRRVEPPQITARMEDGFVDLTFALERRQRDSGGGERLAAIGQDGDRLVGFSVVIEPGWRRIRLGGIESPTYQGGIVIESAGPPSDELVRAIDRLYMTEAAATGMRRAVRVTGISLDGNPTDLDAGPVRIKLFFWENEGEDHYAEAYLNIDVRSGAIELNEKDSVYRMPLVLALSDR